MFFLVCASVEPDKGRAQTLPRSEPEKEKEKQSQTLEVELTRNAVILNGNPMTPERFSESIALKLADKARDEDKIVAVKSRKEVAYSHWMDITGIIEDAGGVITLQLEETQTVKVE